MLGAYIIIYVCRIKNTHNYIYYICYKYIVLNVKINIIAPCIIDDENKMIDVKYQI